MTADHKLSELPVASAIGSNDACLLVSNGTDYQFAMSLLLQYVNSNLNAGAVISFGVSLPQNNSGKNGDVFVNIGTGAIAQKALGTWTVFYTPSSVSVKSGNTLLYGLGLPAASTGNNGDTYINTGTGVFYKKSTGAWNQVFSMQSGPAGAQGLKGDTGPAGADGNSILHGTLNPSNQATGMNGDFYLNTNTYQLFGPKTADDWGTGVSLIPAIPDPLVLDFPIGSNTPVYISNYQSLYADYGNHPTLLIREYIDLATTKCRTDIQATTSYVNGLLESIAIDVPSNDSGKTLMHLQLIIKQ